MNKNQGPANPKLAMHFPGALVHSKQGEKNWI
jgi:hypothetical protein